MEKAKAVWTKQFTGEQERTVLFTSVPKCFIAIAKEETADQITAYSRFVFLTHKVSILYRQDNKTTF